jgi:hypothetical protein
MSVSKLFSRQVLWPACSSLLLVCVGCNPKEWVCWAPDGQHAFVQGADDTWLVDSSGEILGKAPDARAWLPDSRRVIAVHAVKPASWDEYARLIGPERSEKTIAATAGASQSIQGYQGDWSKFGDSELFKKWERAEIGDSYHGDWLIGSVALYLKQTNPQLIAPVLQAMSISEQDLLPDIYEIIIRNVLPSDSPSGQLLARLPDEVLWVSASPNGQAVAFAVAEPSRPALYVISQSANSQAVLVDTGAIEADWSADSQDLVYAKTTIPYNLLEKSVQLGTITRRKVCGPDGQVIAAPEPAWDLAGVILGQNSTTRVACLPDGRILFAAAPMHVPALSGDEPGHFTLFAIRPGTAPALESVVRPDAIAQLPNRVDRFSLSPDKKKVAILDEEGQVSVVFLDTGDLRSLQKMKVYSDTGKYTQLIPTWRNADEVACVVPVGDPLGSPERAEVVLVNLNGQKTAISKSWPDATIKALLPPHD